MKRLLSSLVACFLAAVLIGCQSGVVKTRPDLASIPENKTPSSIPNPVKNARQLNGEMKSDATTVELDNEAALFIAAKTSKSPAVIAELLNSVDNINSKDALGNTALHYILAIRKPDLVKLALSKGADPLIKGFDALTPAQFLIRLQGEHNVGNHTKVDNQFILMPDRSSRLTTSPKVNENIINQEIEKLAIINASIWQKNEIEKQDWYAQQERDKLADIEWINSLEDRQRRLEQPIAEILTPQLPPVTKYIQSAFESVEMFRQRMQRASETRDKQVKGLLTEYRKKVEARNQKVEKRNLALKALQSKMSEYKARMNKQRSAIADKQRRLHSRLLKQVAQKQQDFIAQAFAAAYGSPELRVIEIDGVPKYDAENGQLYAQLSYSRAAVIQEVVLNVPPGKTAEVFFNNIKEGKLNTTVMFKFDENDGNKIHFVEAHTIFEDKNYIAKFEQGATFVMQKPVEVVLQHESALPDFTQKNLELIKFDQAAVNKITLQNPNIKDIQFEAFLLQQQKEFKDDVPQLLKAFKQVPIDRSKWLFVIGAGKYINTDSILYSRRSAQLFAEVAAKTLGVQKGRQIILLDAQATSGSIKDQLKLMLSKVQSGDKIYFYYSGHGIPVVEKSNMPYMLPTDKIPDFIADDDFYKIENIYRLLTQSKASQVIAFMDSCFTGKSDGKSVFGGTKAATFIRPKTLKLGSSGKMVVITAGNNKQFSNAYADKGHRLFSYFLMKALLKGYNRVDELYTRVRADVFDTSLDLGGLNKQTPELQGNGKLTL